MQGRLRGNARLSSACEIRALRFDDVAEVLRLIQRAIAGGCHDHYSHLQRAAIFATYAHTLFMESLGPFESMAAEQQGRLVAFAQFDPTSNRLRALFVDAAVQQRGLGRVLLADIEARALRHGCARLHGAMSLNAISFYTRAGFHPSGGPEHLMAGGVLIPIVRMEKRLRA
ncbi:MAG TPA: GNAT family N-acetyltransferase [Polyangia bacterium]|jgi:GNAT superfamily N-acetyltransferase|nr:GNAT family N-acetyltransferase [Polyangia bacterium]